MRENKCKQELKSNARKNIESNDEEQRDLPVGLCVVVPRFGSPPVAALHLLSRPETDDMHFHE